MNSKSKMFIAVFAVIMMISVALMPLTYSGNNAVVAEETTDDESSFSIVDLIEKLKEKDYDFDFGKGLSLIPVGTVAEGEPTVIPRSVDAPITIENGKTMTFSEEGVTTFTQTGIVVVKTGGTLSLFSDPNTNHTYDLMNNKSSTSEDYDKVIVMENGSMISIFGFTFAISTSSETPFTLLSIESMDGTTGMSADLKLAYTKNSDNTKTFGLTIYNNKIVTIGDSFTAVFNKFKTDANTPDFSFKGTLTVTDSVNFTGVFVTDSLALAEESGYMLIQSTAKVTRGILYAKVDTTKMSADITTTFDASEIYIKTYDVSDKLVKESNPSLTITNGSIVTGETDITITVDGSDIDVDVIRNSELKLTADSIVTFAKTEKSEKIPATETTMTITKPSLTIDGRQADMTFAVTENGVELTGFKATSSAKMTIDKVETTVVIKGEETEDTTVTTTVTEASFEFKDMSIDYVDEKNVSFSIDELSVKATLGKGIYIEEVGEIKYDSTVEIKLKNLSITVKDDKVTATLDMTLSAKVRYNGKDRGAEFTVEGITLVITTKDTKVSDMAVSIDRIYLKSELSTEVIDMGTTPIAKLLAYLGIGSGQMEVEAKKIAYDGENAPYIDYLSVTMKNGIRFKEFNIQYSGDLKIYGEYDDKTVGALTAWFTIAADDVTGHITGYDGKVNNFSVTNAPEVGFGLEVRTGEGIFEAESSFIISNGDAKFEGGKVPFIIEYEGNGKFYANGLTAPGFAFSKDCQKSGTVVIDTDGFRLYSNMFKEMEVVDGDYLFSIPVEQGIKLSFNLSDNLNSGTIEAKKGYKLPSSYSNTSGFSMKSSDGVTGTFTISRVAAGETEIDVLCEAETYTLSYADDFEPSQQYKVDQVVDITTDEPIKEGKEFIGWSDGSGTIYQSGAEYVMPARDVKLTPVFANVVKPTIDKSGNITVDAEDDLAVAIPTTVLDGNWKTITVTVANSKMTFDKTTYTEITKDQDMQYVLFWTLKATEFDSEEIAEIVGNKQVYAIKLALIDYSGEIETDLPSNGSTKFQITVNIFTDRAVKDMKVQYLNEYGFVEEVGVDSYKRCGDGSYDVTFTVNHFSMYTVEPIYENLVTEIYILIGLIILIVIACLIIAACFRKKEPA